MFVAAKSKNAVNFVFAWPVLHASADKNLQKCSSASLLLVSCHCLIIQQVVKTKLFSVIYS